MSFREKSAWISLVCLTATFGSFFGAMIVGVVPTEGARAFGLFFGCVAIFVALQIVLRIVATARAPADARAAVDEREHLIALKAARNAWVVLICGMLLIPASLHAGAHAPLMGYLTMAVLAVSEIVRASSRIFYFRKGL